MIVKKSARGLIRYEEAAKNFTSVLYPKLIEVRSKYNKEISELRKNHKILGIKYNFISKEQQKKEIKLLSIEINKLQRIMNQELTDTYNQARWTLRNTDLDFDFDITVYIGFDLDFLAGYTNKMFYINLVDMKDQEQLEKSVEHELVHVKQSSEYGKDYSDKKLKKIEKTPYYDIKEEMPALATNILRELPPVEQFLNSEFETFKTNNPWVTQEAFMDLAINELMNNSKNLYNYLLQSTTLRSMIYGSKDKQPISKRYNKNKLLKILTESVTLEIRKLLDNHES